MDDLAGRVALITGASGGIGSALARRLAKGAVRVALGYGRNRESADKLVDEIRRGGGDAAAFGADLSDANAPAEQVAAVRWHFGHLDVLVANAGIGEQRDWSEVTIPEFDRAVAVNLRAPFLAAQAALPGMIERRFGRVLFVSSVAAFSVAMLANGYLTGQVVGLDGGMHPR